MKKVILLSVIGVFGLFLLSIVALFYGGFLGSSIARVQHDHSLQLPRSASDIHCSRFISTSSFMDSVEQATFVVPNASLLAFASQIEPLPVIGKMDELKPLLVRPSSWAAKPLIAQYCRKSAKDNLLAVEIFDLDGSNLGVVLATIWN